MRGPLLVVAAILIAGAQSVSAMDFSSPGTDARAYNQMDIGIDLVNHQKYADATAHLEIALQQFPDDVDVLNYLGFAHRMIARERIGTSHDSELRLANIYYGRALDIDPDRKDFLWHMGELYLEMNDVAAAKEKLAAIQAECLDGCPEHDTLAASIAAYRPPPPEAVSAPAALAPAPTD